MQALNSRVFAPAALSARSPALPARRTVTVRASEPDSFQKIEGDVRGKPSDGGKDVVNRTLGQEQLDPELRSEQWNQDKKVLGTEVGAADAMRFTGAIPEIANGRLAMVGVIAAIAAELASGSNVFQQFQMAKLPIAAAFLTLIVATAVPVLRGVPRKSSSGFWSSSAELINGRAAMVGFAAIVISTYFNGSFWALHGLVG